MCNFKVFECKLVFCKCKLGSVNRKKNIKFNKLRRPKQDKQEKQQTGLELNF